MKNYEHLLRRLVEERYVKGLRVLDSDPEYDAVQIQMGVFQKAFRAKLDEEGNQAFLLFDEVRNEIDDMASKAAYLQGIRDGFTLAGFLLESEENAEEEEDATPEEVASSVAS